MTPKKIALVSDWFLPRTGGVESHLVDLARALTARGHRVEVVTATRGPSSAPELPGVTIRRLDCPLMPRFGTIFRPQDVEGLAQLFQAERYDLVHAHSVYSPLALAACWAARGQRLPTMLTAHSLVRSGCIPLFRALDYQLMWSSWPGVITAVSEVVAADLRRSSFASEVHVLPNGLNLPPPVHRADKDSTAPIEILSVSRLVARKRPEALLRAFARLRSRLPASTLARCRLIVLGGGPLYDRMRELASDLGIAHRVELRGWCGRAEVDAALAHADLFVLPTVKEAFGIAALEAAAASLPVVTMRGSGAGELFTPGVDGLVAASDAGLTEAMACLVEDAAARTRIGANARALAERFTWSDVLTRTLALYRLAERRVQDRSGAALMPIAEPARAHGLRLLGRA